MRINVKGGSTEDLVVIYHLAHLYSSKIGGSVENESACNAGDTGSIPG